jgi:hypothetical protein
MNRFPRLHRPMNRFPRLHRPDVWLGNHAHLKVSHSRVRMSGRRGCSRRAKRAKREGQSKDEIIVVDSDWPSGLFNMEQLPRHKLAEDNWK